MTGTVEAINRSSDLAAVSTNEGFSIVEMLGVGIEVGDVLRWEGRYPLGVWPASNVSQFRQVQVYFQNHRVAEQDVPAQLLFRGGQQLATTRDMAWVVA